jgi:hypothetical protein
MIRIILLSSAAALSLAACGGDTAKPQSASAKPVAKPAAKPATTTAASKPTPSKPVASKPAPKSAGSKPSLPPPRQPGTISLEQRESSGTAGNLLGRSEKSLISQYGQPRLNVREGAGIKLQYVTTKCVVDIYLYPSAAGKEPGVIHIDARDDEGRDQDRDMCVQQLSRR